MEKNSGPVKCGGVVRNGHFPPPPPALMSLPPGLAGAAAKLLKPRGKSNGLTYAGGRSGIRIRDNMDDILEARGMYRKHVAEDANSVFRAVSDAIFGTQVYHGLMKKAYTLRRDRSAPAAEAVEHPVAQALAAMLDIRIDIVQYESDSLINCSINKKKGGKSKEPQRRVELCFTPPHQYEPIYSMEHISLCGYIQSLLYKMLYEDIFELHDACQAAKIMLSDMHNKPDVYEKDFIGTAIEALQSNLIPFPYKVAKTLCPDSYRNIEYDVWSRESRISKKPPSRGTSRGGHNESGRRPSKPCLPNTIGELPEGSPVLVRAEGYDDIYGFFVKLTDDRKKAEVRVPGLDICLYPPRKAVLPLKGVPDRVAAYTGQPSSQGSPNGRYDCCAEDFRDMSLGPTHECCEQEAFLPPPTNDEDDIYGDPAATEAAIQAKNMVVMTCGDPDWESKVDFSVPPPPLVTTAGPPIMPNSPPASAGPIMVIPVHYSMLSPFPPPTPLTSMAPSTPSQQLAGIMPSQPPLATPMVRMPNSPMVFQFPSPLPSPMAVVPPHQVFNFPTVTEFESEPYT